MSTRASVANDQKTHQAAGAADFVVVANRLPVDRAIGPDGVETWRTSPGGLVTALEPVMRAKGGAWIGWHGAPDEQVPPFDHEGYRVEPIELSRQEVAYYYEGFSNATLWPLYHDAVAEPEYHREWWDDYRTVNQRFAERAAEVAAPKATVWVHDYQLQLVPAILRGLRPDLKIGYFLHIPFPPIELFLQLPWRRQLLEGLLGADLVGFQVPGAARNYLSLVRRYSEGAVERDRVHLHDGRHAVARAFPISIDTTGFRELAETPEVVAEARQLREELGNPDIILLGVDRLDYTKGLRQRLRAVGELFSEGRLDPNQVTMLQIATPSRERVEEYRRLRDDLDLLVGRINSEMPGIGRSPINYRLASYPRHTMAALYRIADVMVVTPLRDGMNLVAKEYIACHTGNDGALVLSEFAGAALELKQAYLVNPYDLDGLKDTLMEAIRDEPALRRRRMRALRSQVTKHTIDDWATSFLSALDKIASENQQAGHGSGGTQPN